MVVFSPIEAYDKSLVELVGSFPNYDSVYGPWLIGYDEHGHKKMFRWWRYVSKDGQEHASWSSFVDTMGLKIKPRCWAFFPKENRDE